MDRGLRLVRPLEGGLDAWAGAGFEIEAGHIPLSPTGTWKPVG
jgi:3-mercaptopyruvate sulfurtransferase SseA